MNKKKILQVGAHEELITSYYKHFKDKSIVFDYVLRKGGVDFKFSKGCDFLGVLFYITPMQISIIKWVFELRSIVKKGNYKVVHLHLGWSNFFGILACVGLDVKIISHIHSNYAASSIFKKLLRIPLKFIINIFSWKRLACSHVAASQIFYKESIVLKNAVEYSNFFFNSDSRNKIRLELGLEGKLVFCNVGNLYHPKNHLFLIRIFSSLFKIYPNSCLILVGDDYGLKDEIFKMVNSLNIKDNVLFLGARKDVANVLSASDIFLFPSLFEGFGISLLEAQVNGLPCICSDTIPNDAIITNFCYKVGITNHDIPNWLNIVGVCLDMGLNEEARFYRSTNISNIFDVSKVSQDLENIYLSAFNINVS